MEYLEKLMALAILGGVGALLIFLLRRARAKDNAAQAEEVRKNVETPAVVVEKPPVVVTASAPAPIVNVKAAENRRAKTRRKKATAAPPLVKVMGLLKEKDALVAAFLLREILAPPVSRRG